MARHLHRATIPLRSRLTDIYFWVVDNTSTHSIRWTQKVASLHCPSVLQPGQGREARFRPAPSLLRVQLVPEKGMRPAHGTAPHCGSGQGACWQDGGAHHSRYCGSRLRSNGVSSKRRVCQVKCFAAATNPIGRIRQQRSTAGSSQHSGSGAFHQGNSGVASRFAVQPRPNRKRKYSTKASCFCQLISGGAL